MNINHAKRNNHSATSLASSFSSILFSIIASSHHSIHLGILFLLGGSTNAMVALSGVLWIRRSLVIATIITSFYSIYRLKRHIHHMPKFIVVINVISVFLSFVFVIYTLLKFGW